jgi:NAD(P)-dependent dehydrogenase (short-subunit alcohol dehydrogenase family)
VALVTGGGSGIGAAGPQQPHGGARVAVADISGGSESEADLWIDCDVTSSTAVDHAVESTVQGLGGLDVLVCAAGMSGPVADPWDMTDEHWRRIHAVNSDGVFYACRAAARHMLAAGRGHIVNVASVAGQRGPAGLAAYAASKAAVIGLTQSFGLSLAPHGVFVNAVAPGLIGTPLIGETTEEGLAMMVSRMAIKRMGTADEVARLIAFMCSDDASFTVGATFDISAGRTLT